MRDSIGDTGPVDARKMRGIPPSIAPTIAVIGCGAIAESFYLPTIAKFPSILETLTLVDSNEARAQQLASKFRVRNYLSDYHALLNKVDGVIVAVPHHLHHTISLDFLREGTHVLCEKPLAESAVDVKEMVAQAGKSGVTISVNNTRRLFPSFLKVKELLATGTIGSPLSLKWFEGVEYNWPITSGYYFNSRVPRKGALLDQGAHALDLICWWLGGKPHVSSSKNDSFGGPEAVACIKFEYDNCLGEVRVSWLSKLQNTYIINGELGAIEGGVYDWSTLAVTSKSGKKKAIRLRSEYEEYSDFGVPLVANFVDVITKSAHPLVPGGDVIASIELMEEAYNTASRFSMPWCEAVDVLNV